MMEKRSYVWNASVAVWMLLTSSFQFFATEVLEGGETAFFVIEIIALICYIPLQLRTARYNSLIGKCAILHVNYNRKKSHRIRLIGRGDPIHLFIIYYEYLGRGRRTMTIMGDVDDVNRLRDLLEKEKLPIAIGKNGRHVPLVQEFLKAHEFLEDGRDGIAYLSNGLLYVARFSIWIIVIYAHFFY